nr:LysR substrate-binding domain-containing protein [Lysobacter silvisoli]
MLSIRTAPAFASRRLRPDLCAGRTGAVRPIVWDLPARASTMAARPHQDFSMRISSLFGAAALAGLGIAAFTAPTVRDDLAAGRLLRVLPGHHAGRRHYYAVYPHARQLAPPVRAFTEFMRAHYAAPPPAA